MKAFKEFLTSTALLVSAWVICPQAAAQTQWWTSFDDATLDSLIVTAIDRNYDLAAAARRIAVARAALGQTRAGWMPEVGLSAGWTADGPLSRSSQSATPRTSEWAIGAQMSWEIDIFGKVAAQVKGKEASLGASKAQYEGMMLSIAAETATAYINLCQARASLAVALSHCESQEKIEKIALARMEAGIGNALDVAQARVTLYQTRASIPSLENSVDQAINAIASLTASDPSVTATLKDSTTSAPLFQAIIPSAIPLETIRKRPDVTQAERQIDVAAANLGVSKKEYLPSLSLTGEIATHDSKLSGLTKAGAPYYSVAPTLSWTLFDGMARKYAVAEARAQMEIAVDNYNATLTTALQEARNAISTYEAASAQVELYDAVVRECTKAMELSLSLYKQGLTPFTNVADAQVNLIQSEQSLIASRAQASTALIDIYKAFGGELQ